MPHWNGQGRNPQKNEPRKKRAVPRLMKLLLLIILQRKIVVIGIDKFFFIQKNIQKLYFSAFVGLRVYSCFTIITSKLNICFSDLLVIDRVI